MPLYIYRLATGLSKDHHDASTPLLQPGRIYLRALFQNLLAYVYVSDLAHDQLFRPYSRAPKTNTHKISKTPPPPQRRAVSSPFNV